jgi:hypothetical protein
MKHTIITGAVAGLLVILLQGLIPRFGTGEIAFLMRLIGAAGIGALGGVLVYLIRR